MRKYSVECHTFKQFPEGSDARVVKLVFDNFTDAREMLSSSDTTFFRMEVIEVDAPPDTLKAKSKSKKKEPILLTEEVK